MLLSKETPADHLTAEIKAGLLLKMPFARNWISVSESSAAVQRDAACRSPHGSNTTVLLLKGPFAGKRNGDYVRKHIRIQFSLFIEI